MAGRYDNFIGGEWVAPASGVYRENHTPSTGEVFCEVGSSTSADIEVALDGAHAVQAGWASQSPAARAAVLNAIADAIDANREMLAVAESYENGKPVRATLNADIPLPQTTSAPSRVLCALRKDGSRRSTSRRTRITSRSPSAWGQIIPFNFPLLMAAWKLAPALAMGNCAVLKPASPTPGRS